MKHLQTFPSLHFVSFKQGLMKAKLCLHEYMINKLLWSSISTVALPQMDPLLSSSEFTLLGLNVCTIL